MSLTITPLSPALGAQISGVDISREISAEQRDAIEQALLQRQRLADVDAADLCAEGGA